LGLGLLSERPLSAEEGEMTRKGKVRALANALTAQTRAINAGKNTSALMERCWKAHQGITAEERLEAYKLHARKMGWA
jgi:hypothetical protein